MSVSLFQLPCLAALILRGRDPELCWGVQLTPLQCWRRGDNSWVPSHVPSPLSRPGGCQLAVGLSRLCVALALPLHDAYWHLPWGAGSGSALLSPARSWGDNTPLQEEACGCLSSCISGCGEILGKSEILTGLEETSSVCGNRNCAPNQGGKQNPRPNQKAFRASQPPPAPLARAEQRDPSFPVWAETPGSGLLISASSIPARITLADPQRQRHSSHAPSGKPLLTSGHARALALHCPSSKPPASVHLGPGSERRAGWAGWALSDDGRACCRFGKLERGSGNRSRPCKLAGISVRGCVVLGCFPWQHGSPQGCSVWEQLGSLLGRAARGWGAAGHRAAAPGLAPAGPPPGGGGGG